MADGNNSNSGEGNPSGDTPRNDEAGNSDVDSGVDRGVDRGNQGETGQPARKHGNRGNVESLRAYHEARRLAKQNGDGTGSSSENRSSTGRGSRRAGKRNNKRRSNGNSSRENNGDSESRTPTQREIDIQAVRDTVDDDEPAPKQVKKVLPFKKPGKGGHKDTAKFIHKASSVAANFIGEHWEISTPEAEELAQALHNLPMGRDNWLMELATKYEPYIGFAIVSGSIFIPRVMYSIALYQAQQQVKQQNAANQFQAHQQNQAQAHPPTSAEAQASGNASYTGVFQDQLNQRYRDAH